MFLTHRSRRVRVALACAAVALASTVAACSSGHPATTSTSSSPSGFAGDPLSPPVQLSAADLADTFTSTTGQRTTLAALQQGRLMLLYFGYTHCPDVCPTTMADLGQALRSQSSLIQAHVQVVFVTSDPVRDTPAVMKAWLANFDPGLVRPFVGLTASLKQIDAVATSLGVPLEPPVKEPNGTYSVEHGAQTLAFVNDKASLLWLAGTTVTNYSHDIAGLITKLDPS